VDDDLFHSDTTTGTQDGGELGKIRSRPDDVEKSQIRRDASGRPTLVGLRETDEACVT
jgi:hypothetical protein